MQIFNKYIKQAYDLCAAAIKPLPTTGRTWELQEKTTFLMDRDTAVELGGYPKESINIIVPTSDFSACMPLQPGVYCIGEPKLLAEKVPKEKGLFFRTSKKENPTHISFGKLVFIETEDISDDDAYAFTQGELLTDSKIRMKDVMLRQSPTHYNINLRVGKQAIAAGFDASIMGETIYQAFCSMPQVKKVVVILLFGDNTGAAAEHKDLYKELLPTAEKIKEITLTLNHIFDGINMDCGHCDVREVCNEIEGMREMHQRKVKQVNGDGSNNV